MSKKVLIAYFSASGVTARVAKTMADAVGADLYEICPEQPYTSADLNWMDKKSRSTVEMNDPACRPAIAGEVQNMDQYDTVLVGFPVWWYVEPRIVDTFLESSIDRRENRLMRVSEYKTVDQVETVQLFGIVNRCFHGT